MYLTFSCFLMYILWNCPSTGDMMSSFISRATCSGSTDCSSRSWVSVKIVDRSVDN